METPERSDSISDLSHCDLKYMCRHLCDSQMSQNGKKINLLAPNLDVKKTLTSTYAGYPPYADSYQHQHSYLNLFITISQNNSMYAKAPH